MKVISILLLILVFLNLSIFSQEYVKVISIKANLRGTPDNQGVIITTVNLNEQFELIQQKNAWFLIQTPRYVGWIHGNNIEKVKSEETTSTQIKVDVNYLNFEDDKGYDVVRTQKRAFLYSEPDGVLLSTLSPNSLLILLDRNHSQGWLNVIDLDSGREGWIYYKDSKVYLSRSPKKSKSVFESRSTNSNRSPEVTISNNTDRTLTVKLGSDVISILPNSSKTFIQSPGTYKFYASVPRAYPLLGEETFSNGRIYTWTFYISTR